jgi:hypothetical protein
MYDPECQLYPPDVDCELVTLVVIPRYLKGDYGGLPAVPDADVASHFQYPWRVPRVHMVYLHRVALLHVSQGNCFSLLRSSVLRLNQPMSVSGRSLFSPFNCFRLKTQSTWVEVLENLFVCDVSLRIF